MVVEHIQINFIILNKIDKIIIMNDIFQYLENNKILYKNKNLYLSALTHPSKKADSAITITDNKVLSVIGNEFIALAVSTEEYLLNSAIDAKTLLKNQRDIVLESSLAKIAKNEGLDKYLMLGRSALNISLGDEACANVLSALIGAIYFDLGFQVAKDFFYVLLSRNLLQENIDYKTKLQVEIQKFISIDQVSYEYRCEGPKHDLTFIAALFVCNKLVCEGIGKSKKKAEMDCARIALTEKLNFLMNILEDEGINNYGKRKN